MTDFRTSAAPRPTPDENEREARHRVLIALLGAYADGELAPETASQIDAHLIACGRCSRELGVQRALRQRLAAEPPAAASPALRDRIAAAVSAAPAVPPVVAAPPHTWPDTWTSPRRWRRGSAVAAIAATAAVVGIWAVLAVAGVPGGNTARQGSVAEAGGAVSVTRLPTPASSVPMLRGVL